MGSYFCVVAAVAAGDIDVIDVADVIDAGGVGVVVDVAVAAVLAAVADVAVVDANVSVLAAPVHEMSATIAPTPHAPRNVRHQRANTARPTKCAPQALPAAKCAI